MNVYVPPIIEKVYNIQGSTAAPGSGEYHRYRALRRRERTLAAVLEKEFREKEEQRVFEEQRMLKKMHVEERTRKKKLRRDKKKMNKKIKQRCIKKSVGDGVNDVEHSITNANNTYNENDEFGPNRSVCKTSNANEQTTSTDNNHNELLFQQIFPQIISSNIDFNTYEEYEDYLARVQFMHNKVKGQSVETAILPKHIDDIIIHEEE